MSRAAALFCLFAALLVLASACRPPMKKSVEELEDIARSSDEALAQSYENFLAQRGRLLEASRVESLLVATRYPGGVPPTYRDKVDARLSALELTVDGLTAADVKQLRRADIPLFKLDWRTQRTGQAATSDVVVVAEVLEKIDALDPPDGYRSSVRLAVRDVLKGEVPANTIVVRRLSGTDGRGRAVEVRNEFDPALGKEYLLFLSNPLYDYHLQYPDDRAARVGVGAAAEAAPRVLDAEADVLDRATAVAAMDSTALDALDRRHRAFYLERYPGLRLEWLSRSAREQVLADVRRVVEAMQPLQPAADADAPPPLAPAAAEGSN